MIVCGIPRQRHLKVFLDLTEHVVEGDALLSLCGIPRQRHLEAFLDLTEHVV